LLGIGPKTCPDRSVIVRGAIAIDGGLKIDDLAGTSSVSASVGGEVSAAWPKARQRFSPGDVHNAACSHFDPFAGQRIVV
jgi:hypothetical protein